METIGRKTLRWVVFVSAIGVLAPQAALADKKVVRLHLHGEVLEAPREDAELAALFGQEPPRALRELVQTINQAARDINVGGMVLLIEQPQVGLAQVEELTRAFREFRAKGKKVYCFIDEAGNLEYALAAAASDHITLAENSELGTYGLRAELDFYKGLLDKIGVQADMMHCGAYKSALEPFTRTEPSKENAEMVNWLLDGLYDRFTGMIAEGRKLTPEDVKAAVDASPLTANQALERKLIDAVGSFGDFRQMVHKEFGKDVEIVKDYGEKSPFALDVEDTSNPFALFQKISELFSGAMSEGAESKPGIGLIYIDGGIVVGRNEGGFMGGSTAGSTTIRAALERAREDQNVKAVVVRVDSPGGSALASDIIWDAATRCAKEKPLIVSMGNVAGSGGYYVSIPGDTIFAEETTITGSIGVVGGKIVWKGLMEDKLGITTTEFQRGKNAGLMSMHRPWTDAERKWMMDWMTQIYDQFKGRVKQSRGDRIKGDLEQLAGGRVYTGKQALKLGLVDQIGGLSDAMAFASKKAGLGSEYEVYVLPKPKELADILKEMFGEQGPDDWEIRVDGAAADDVLPGLLGSRYPSGELGRSLLPMLRLIAPQQLKRAATDLNNLLILHEERVGCFMPAGLSIR
jgi:protease-4